MRLAIPVFDQVLGDLTISWTFLEEVEGEDGQFKEEQVKTAHHSALNLDRRCLRWLPVELTGETAKDLSLHGGARGDGEVSRDLALLLVAKVVHVEFEDEVSDDVDGVIGDFELDHALVLIVAHAGHICLEL